MEVNIIAVGRIKENYIQAGINNFTKRLKRYTDVNIFEVKADKIGNNLSGAELEQLKTREGKRVLTKIPADNYTIALSVRGKPMTSKGLASSIQNIQLKGYSKIAFIIGGTMGLGQNVLDEVNYVLSLSHMTFTHQMIRLILLEQVYRAFKILQGEPYHK